MTADWGQAKIQILALRPDIFAKLEAGKTVAAIYEELRSSGRIKMSSVTFYRWCNRLRKMETKPAKAEAVVNVNAPKAVQPLPSPSRSSSKIASRLSGQLAPEDDDANSLM